MKRIAPLAFAACIVAAPSLHASDVEVTLSGSRASMLRQNRIAKLEEYSFLRTPVQVRRYVDNGHLVPLAGNENYGVIAGYPYARPVVRAMIERLSADYRAACGERLIVTSLTRPSTRQPSNASPLSVHPAGMAVDLRVSQKAACRTWLMAELLRLEADGVLDATLERNPPHFHVAVFPGPYSGYEQTIAADSMAAEAVRLLEEAVALRDAAALEPVTPEPSSASPALVAARTPVLVRIVTLMARRVLPV